MESFQNIHSDHSISKTRAIITENVPTRSPSSSPFAPEEVQILSLHQIVVRIASEWN